jgi:hypothetical protein
MSQSSSLEKLPYKIIGKIGATAEDQDRFPGYIFFHLVRFRIQVSASVFTNRTDIFRYVTSVGKKSEVA